MTWIDKLERRCGGRGIPYLINGLMLGQLAAGLIILLFSWQFAYQIDLGRAYLAVGQVWRLVTFLFQPIWLGSALGVLNLVFYFWVGNALTRVWGDFRMTLYIALGMLGAWISCFLTGYASCEPIFMSLLLAYAWLWPNQTVLLMGIIPFKIKYLGWYEMAWWAVSFFRGGFPTKVCLVLGLAGFWAFYGREVFDWCVDTVKSWKRRRDWENRNR